MDVKTIISVAGGGFLGGIARYWLSLHFTNSGILIANLGGCFLLSFLTYYVIERGLLANWLNAGLGTGFIGAFTTFSSFATTTINYSSPWSGLGYFLLSAIGGLALALLGFIVAKQCGVKQND